MKNFPTLYQKTNAGAIQQWTISVEGTTIKTVHGQVGGKLQEALDTIKEGKNIGQSNETTPEMQAEREAKAKWTKQLKKGYVDTIAAAEAGEVDAIIEGGLPPMLSPNKSHPKDDLLAKTAKFPAYGQPKLDGMRCIAIIEGGNATVWSRTRKRIPTIPHIVDALAKMFPTEQRVVLDGELYNHQYKDHFEDLMSILRGDGPDPEGEYLNAQFHVYDCPERFVRASQHTQDAPFEHRNRAVSAMLGGLDPQSPIKRVETVAVETMQQLLLFYEECLTRGYEGSMYRSPEGKYEADKRSKFLLKMKEFIDQEFPIVGANTGRGKDADVVTTFDVQLPNGKVMPVRSPGTYAKKREFLKKPQLWQGKQLTVNFKRWTADGMLYIPTGKGIRDYE
jgi:ATP-dependent DNA ligase